MTEPEQIIENKTVSNGNQAGRDPETGRFTAGNDFAQGRKEGSENFATKWRRFIEKIAAKNGITPDEVDEQLYITAFNKAKGGKYLFFKDIQDRLHGKAVQPLGHKGNIEVGIRNINYIVPEKPKENDGSTETMGGHKPDTDTEATRSIPSPTE